MQALHDGYNVYSQTIRLVSFHQTQILAAELLSEW